jgi:serine protease Do
MDMKNKQLIISLVLLAALLLGGCGPVASSSLFNLAPVANAAQSLTANAAAEALAPVGLAGSSVTTTSQGATLSGLQDALVAVYEKVNPSVVNIQVEVSGVGGGLGSGFVWDNQGHIVTNNHVVENADRILVNFSDGSTVEASLVGTDPNSDLAVIKVDGVSNNLLKPVRLVDSNKVKVGQLAIAIGNPFGLSGTMTEGIISALSRSLPAGETTNGGSYTIPDIIQTDAAINPGNSGGVLVNIDGEVMGVTAAIRSSSDSNSGIGFVIPSNIVSRVVPALIKDGKISHTYIGISGVTLSLDLAKSLGLPETQQGVVVVQVSQGSPAEKAGLIGATIRQTSTGDSVPEGADIITAIDNQPVKTFEDLSSYLFSSTQVGQTVTLTILRQGREQAVKLVLSAIPSQSFQ